MHVVCGILSVARFTVHATHVSPHRAALSPHTSAPDAACVQKPGERRFVTESAHLEYSHARTDWDQQDRRVPHCGVQCQLDPCAEIATRALLLTSKLRDSVAIPATQPNSEHSTPGTYAHAL